MNRPGNCIVVSARALEFHNTQPSVQEWHHVLSVLADLSPKAVISSSATITYVTCLHLC